MTSIIRGRSRASSGSPEAHFEAIVEGFDSEPRLAPIARAYRESRRAGGPKKFGSNALKTGGKMFAMLHAGQLVVKLPKERAAELVRSGRGSFFDPGHGRLMKQWVVVTQEPASWRGLVREALTGLESDRPIS